MSGPSLADTDPRPRLAHYFVTPNESVTMRFVRSHRRDVDDVVARDEKEQEKEADEEPGSSRDWCR